MQRQWSNLALINLLTRQKKLSRAQLLLLGLREIQKHKCFGLMLKLKSKNPFVEMQKELLIIEQPGGTWGSTDLIVESIARFSEGETGYFFVEYLASDRYVPVGMFQGKFNVLMDPYSQNEIVHRYALHPSQKFDHRFIPLPAKENRVSTQMFEEQIGLVLKMVGMENQSWRIQ